MFVRPIVLLGGKGVRVTTPFINAFRKKKAWNLPKSSTNLNDFKTCFFSPKKCGDFKTLFFPLLEMWRFSFLFENFPKCSLHHVCFNGGLFNRFLSQKINEIKLKLTALRLRVCLSWFKETRGLHTVRRSRVPIIYIYNILGVYLSGRRCRRSSLGVRGSGLTHPYPLFFLLKMWPLLLIPFLPAFF
jgi:hypothetical protein